MKNTKYYLLILVGIALITFWRVLFVNSYFGYGDARVFTRSNKTWNAFFSYPSIWTTLAGGMGEIDLGLSQYPIYSGYALLTQLGLDSRFVSKLIFFIPSIFLPALGSFLLVKHFTKTNLPALVGSIVYSYNVNALLMQSSLLQISIAYSFAPLVLYMFIRSLEMKNLKLTISTGLVCFINSFYEFRIFYIEAFVLLFYLIFYVFVTEKKFNFWNLIRTTFHATLPFLIVIILNAYWLIPYVKTGSIRDNSAFSRPLFGDKYMSLKQSVAFFSPWWTAGHGYANGVIQPIPNYFWAIPFFAVLGFVLNIKNPKVHFFLFLSLLGILLTKQSDKPFPNLYLWLYQHFPGFNAYREASKFFVILSLGYSGLIAYFILALHRHRLTTTIFTLLVSLLFLWNIKPMVTGEILGLFIPKNKPRDFEIVEDFIFKQPEFFRTTWLPASGIWGYYDSLHPKINLHTAYFDSFGTIMSSQDDFIPAINKSKLISNVNHQVIDFFTQNNSNIFLDLLNVKYVIVPLEDIQNDDDVFVNYGLQDREYLLNLLDRTKYLSRINIGTQQIVVYENSDYRPLIYTTSEPENIHQPISYKAVHFRQLDPAQYEINLEDLVQPIFINFSDTYNSDWTLYLDGKPLPPTIHKDTSGLFNSFFIDPKYIRTNNPKLTLFFKSQNYVYLGSAISLAGLLLAFGAIILSTWGVKPSSRRA